MAELEDDGTLGKSILDKVFTVKMPTGKWLQESSLEIMLRLKS